MPAAAIGAVAAVGSAVVGGAAAKSAAKKNAKAINTATDAQVQANKDSLALQQSVYNQNYGLLSPYVGRGNVAGDYYNALLGLPSAPVQSFAPQNDNGAYVNTPYGIMPASSQATTSGQGPWGSTVTTNPDGTKTFGGVAGIDITTATQNALNQGTSLTNAVTNNLTPQGTFYPGNNQASTGTAQPTQTAVTPVTAQQAFDTYKNSTGYQFRLGEGNNSVNSGYAGAGMLQSGAAQKALIDYNQNMASAEFGNYMNLLSNQAGMGLQAGSALAGVGQNYANSASNINSNTANALGQGAIAQANNSNAGTAGVLGAIGQGISGATNALFPTSSYQGAGFGTGYTPFGDRAGGIGGGRISFDTPGSAFSQYTW